MCASGERTRLLPRLVLLNDADDEGESHPSLSVLSVHLSLGVHQTLPLLAVLSARCSFCSVFFQYRFGLKANDAILASPEHLPM